MENIFICYSKCSTCNRAKKYLEEKGVSFNERDIKEDKPSLDELKDFHEKSGLDIKRFFNTSGGVYRALGLKDKLGDMTLEEKLEILASDGMLVKRPIFQYGDKLVVGFKEAEWDELLSN